MHNASGDPQLILASASPRRRHLLEQAGLFFSVVPSDIDETVLPVSSPGVYVREAAAAKAADISEKYPDKWVIGADTIVLIDGTILGKPGSRSVARTMLKRLSGQTHRVLTGYVITCKGRQRHFSETITTEVLFKHLTDAEIEWYINTGEPFDKAGAYAIQGRGTFLVKRINGSYTNVVGLPVCEVIEFLIEEGVVGLSRTTGSL